MTNKDTKFINPKDVIRTQDGKIDLFQTILARKDPTAQIPVFADPQPQPVATSFSVTISDGTKATEASPSSFTSSGPSLPWRSTHVASSKTSASASAASSSAASASSPYANSATTTTDAADSSADTAATATAIGKLTTSAKPVMRKTLWSAVFVEYCKNPLTIPDNIRHWHDNEHIIIKDAYAKAKVHMLVLPRMPVNKVTDLVGEAGIRIVEGLARVANTLMATLRAENAYLDFKMGFHVMPSMSQLHLHVISQDFCSPCLKKAVHWNSFNTRFFISPEEVVRTIREKGSFEKTEEEMNEYRSMKKANLVCNQCSQVMKSIPMLTNHLNEHFNHKVKALKRL